MCFPEKVLLKPVYLFSLLASIRDCLYGYLLVVLCSAVSEKPDDVYHCGDDSDSDY